mgnify:CR=1 FL=1
MTAVCLHFITNVSCLFTLTVQNSAVYLHCQLFVYICLEWKNIKCFRIFGQNIDFCNSVKCCAMKFSKWRFANVWLKPKLWPHISGYTYIHFTVWCKTMLKLMLFTTIQMFALMHLYSQDLSIFDRERRFNK